MERKTPAILTILTSLGLGIIGNIFFNERDLGLSVLLFTILVVGVMIGFAWHNGMVLSARRLWLLLPILFFAGSFFVRANTMILLADALAVLALTALMSRHFDGKYLDEVGFPAYFMSFISAGFTAFIGGLDEIGKVSLWLKSRQKTDKPSSLRSVVRGVFIALPILIVFAVLLSSADPIFQDRLLSFTRWFNGDFDISGIMRFFVITGVITWLSLGAIVFAIRPNTVSDEAPEEEAIDKKSPRFINLNMTETGIVLGGVVLLFAFFVFIQFTYLFGQQAIFLESMTFANYARRGFFELVTVSVMTLGLMLSLDRITLRRAQSQQAFFRLASVLLVGLTLVMLASAWRRMSLYEEAYGFSHLRLYTHVFMVWLGILLLVGLLDIFRVRAHIFVLGALMVAIGYLGTLNVINVDAYIAQANIERYLAGEDLDVCYFNNFSADAVPVVAEFYPNIADSEAGQSVYRWLYGMNMIEDYRHEDTNFLEANLSHDAVSASFAGLSLTSESARVCTYNYGD